LKEKNEERRKEKCGEWEEKEKEKENGFCFACGVWNTWKCTAHRELESFDWIFLQTPLVFKAAPPLLSLFSHIRLHSEDKNCRKSNVN
jgi:hypothetical protein